MRKEYFLTTDHTLSQLIAIVTTENSGKAGNIDAP